MLHALSFGILMARLKLDRIDLRILNVLQANGRLSNKELADQVGLTASPCLARVKRLEKGGLISRYLAHVELKKLADVIFVVSLIYLHDADYKTAKRLEDYILGLPQTIDFMDVNGECDYIARFACRGTEDYSDIARALLEEQAYRVRQISSYIVLRELKQFRGYDLSYLVRAE